VEGYLPSRDVRSAFLILPQLPVAETKFWVSAVERWGPPPFTQGPPPPRDRGSTVNMAPRIIEAPQLPLPWPVGCRFYAGRGKLRIAGAAVPLSPHQALKRYHPERSMTLSLPPASEPELRNCAQRNKQTL